MNKNYACTESNTDPDAKIIYKSLTEQLKNLESERRTLSKKMKETKAVLDAEKKRRCHEQSLIVL